MEIDLGESLEGTKLLQRARDIASSGGILNCHIDGYSASGRVEGKSKASYYCGFTLDPSGHLASYYCDCEASRRYVGPCKHALALLLYCAPSIEVKEKPSEVEGHFGDGDNSDFGC